MKYTNEQLNRSIKKLAKVAGIWNCPNLNVKQRRDIEFKLFDAAFAIIKKSGHMKTLEESTRKAFVEHGVPNDQSK